MDKQAAYDAYMLAWKQFSIFCRNHPDTEDVAQNELNDIKAHELRQIADDAFDTYDAISQDDIIEGRM